MKINWLRLEQRVRDVLYSQLVRFTGISVNLRKYEYILEGHTVVPCPKGIDWVQWMANADPLVCQTQINHVVVSTVFTGLAHPKDNNPPQVFETRVFGGPLDGRFQRRTTWEDAEKTHGAMVERVNAAMT